MTYITSKNFILPNNSSDYYGLDTETTGLDPVSDKARLVQIGNTKEQFVYDLFKLDPEQIKLLGNFIASNKFYIHNALFDVPFLFNTFDIKFINCIDTMILYQAILRQTYSDSRSTIKYPKSLSVLMRLLFNKDISKEEQTSDWSMVCLSEEQIEYASKDALFVYMIGNKLIKHEASSTLNFRISMRAINVLSRIRLNGICLDTNELDKLVAEWTNKVNEAEKQCEKIFGNINIKSSVQIGDWISKRIDTSNWEKTEKTGKLITDADALKAHLSELPELEYLITYKKYNKYLSTYGDNIKLFINPKTNRIHGSYTLGYTDTGRLSSMKPNIQNFPREEWYRKLFIPQNDNVLVCADFSQVEVRVAAILSGEENMLKAYREGKDLYKHTASLLFRKPEEEITKEERQRAKAVVLGLQFGMGYKTLCKYALNYGVKLSEEESNTLVVRYKEAYPRLTAWQVETTTIASELLSTQTVCGMKRKLSDDNYYTCSLNTPVQGSAAEVILVALTVLDEYIQKNKLSAKIVATVHDEILVECSKEDSQVVKKALETIMHKAFIFVFDRVGIRGADANIVEAHIGGNWYEAK